MNSSCEHISGFPFIVSKNSEFFFQSWNILESTKRPSKYHLPINFLTQKEIVFPISKNSKTKMFQ